MVAACVLMLLNTALPYGHTHAPGGNSRGGTTATGALCQADGPTHGDGVCTLGLLLSLLTGRQAVGVLP